MNTLLKFDGPHLEELLERVQSELGSDVTIVEANRTRRGGFGGFFAKEWFEVVVDAGAAASIAGPAVEAASPTVDVDDPFLALAAEVDDVRETATLAPQAVQAFELALAGAKREASVAAEPVPERAQVPAPATKRLRDLDLPLLLAHLDAMVPPALVPATSSPTIAVVGDHHSVRGVAAALAMRLGLDESEVIVASPEPQPDLPIWVRLHTPGDVEARADRWRRSPSPRVIAVELTPGREGHAWAAAMLAAIDADQVRLVAKAWQLTEQLETKATALGGIDGLDLVEMAAAAEPELFLELDVPVLGIDGRPATAELWAALLYERRTDGDHR